MLYVNFTNDIFKGSHIGFTNGFQPYTLANTPLDIAALKTLVGYSKSRVYAIINENPDRNGNHPPYHSVTSYFIMFLTLCNLSYVITIIDYYVIINSFGDYYQDFQLVIGTFQMYLHINK